MAQWQDLRALNSAFQGQVSDVYKGMIPLEIRKHLCEAIESQDWESAAVDENKAKTCLNALLLDLDQQQTLSVQQKNILGGPDYSAIRDFLVKNFATHPQSLAVILAHCLREEKRILASAFEAQGCSSPAMEQKMPRLQDDICKMQKLSTDVKQEIKSLENLYERLNFIQKNWQSRVEERSGSVHSQPAVEEECRQQENFITGTKQNVLRQIWDILNQADQITASLVDVQLPEWKHRQQMACIGSPVDTSLDNLEKWFTAVAQELLQVGKQLQKLQDLINKYSSSSSNLDGEMAEIETCSLSLLKKLLSNALVVQQQPVMASLPQRPQIIKTNVRFAVSVRFLANLTEFVQKSLLRVTPYFDKDVAEVHTLKGVRQFDFDGNDYKFMDVDTPGGGLEAEFSHMSLKDKKGKAKGSQKIKTVDPPACKRKRNKSEEDLPHLTVLEELHVIKFVMKFKHNGLEWDIETSSLPLVVISSTNQVPAAWATVMWFNMLSNSEPRDLSLFLSPPSLHWEQLSQLLSWQFLSAGKLGLNENQLEALKDKFTDGSDDLVHWKDFSKCDKKESSAWFWIDGILDLIQKHLANVWEDGSIMGFVTRAKTTELLQEKPTGTFLLRFSESNKDGAITFSWVEHRNGEPLVHAVEPYTKQELSVNSLPYIIYNYSLKGQENTNRNPLLYLYPDIHKDSAFRRHYRPKETTEPKNLKNGYVPKNFIPVSTNPTPPPSPTRELEMMDVDLNASMERQKVIQDLFPDIAITNQNLDMYTPSFQINRGDHLSLE